MGRLSCARTVGLARVPASSSKICMILVAQRCHRGNSHPPGWKHDDQSVSILEVNYVLEQKGT